MVDDSSKNPESNTFAYLQFVIEALQRLGRLELAMERVEQRLPSEMFKIVEKAIGDVSPNVTMLRNKLQSSQTQMSQVESDIIDELLDALYARFEAIAEGHRVVHEVICKIVPSTKSGKENNLSSGFKGLWEIFQSEVCFCQ